MIHNLKFITPLLTWLFFAEAVSAQTNDHTSVPLKERFHSYNTFQLLNGSSTTSVALNSVNGFSFGRFFTGIGTGFDYYYHTSVPLFLEARFDLLKGRRTLQVFGNGGVSFAFGSANNEERSKTGPYKPAPMYGAGIDVLFPAKSNAFILGLAFSNKNIIQMVDNNTWDPILNRVENIPIREEYSLNRISIRVGWKF